MANGQTEPGGFPDLKGNSTMARTSTTPTTSAGKAPVAQQTARLRVIAADETFSPSRSVAGRKVEVQYAVKAGEAAKNRYAVSAVLDFTGCSEAEVLELATKTVVIDLQRQFRVMAGGKDAAKAYEAGTWSRVNVKTDVIDVERARGPVDPVKAVTANFSKLDSAKRAEMLAMLQAMVAEDAAAAEPAK